MAHVIRSIGRQLLLAVVLALLPAAQARAQCLGDCNGDGSVGPSELTNIIALINCCPCADSLLGGADSGCAATSGCANLGFPGGTIPQCTAADRNDNQCITAGELTGVINDILDYANGCPPVATMTPTNTPAATSTPVTPAATSTPVTPAVPTNTPVTPAAATSTPVTPAATSTPTNTPITPTATNTPLPSATPTNTQGQASPTPSATPTPPQGVVTPNVCGNGTPEPANGEDCDTGGTCVGGANAGTACTNETQCIGNGVCDVGTKFGTNCASSADCAGAACVHCKTFGGNGCAANCTTEKTVAWNLVAGTLVTGGKCKAGTSCAVLNASLVLNLPLSGSQSMRVGKAGSNNTIPFVTKADSVVFNKIPVSTLACACVRGAAAKSCGGYLFEADGTPAADCTFEDTCAAAGKPPCAYVNGPGNGASGVIGCGTTFGPVNVMTTQDAGGILLPPPPTPTPPIAPPIVTLSGSGGAGSAIAINSIRLGQTTGLCTGSDPALYGPDGVFCTDDDPEAMRGAVSTVVTVTGTATAKLFNNGVPGFNTPPDPTPGLSAVGHVFSCSNLAKPTPVLTGSGLASAFDTISNTLPGSGVITNVQYAQ